jgi:hypothetical protein
VGWDEGVTRTGKRTRYGDEGGDAVARWRGGAGGENKKDQDEKGNKEIGEKKERRGEDNGYEKEPRRNVTKRRRNEMARTITMRREERRGERRVRQGKWETTGGEGVATGYGMQRGVARMNADGTR